MDERVEALMRKAEKHLNIAARDIASGDWDAATSRSYYAMFYAATAILASRGVHVKTHKGLLTRFREEFVKAGAIEKDYEVAISRAQTLREVADYEVTVEVTKEKAESVLKDAGKFVARIGLALEGP